MAIRWGSARYVVALAFITNHANRGMWMQSATIAAIAMIERHLALAEDAIAKAREPNSNTSQDHLPADAADDQLCPTEPFAIACPCAKGSPSYGWKAKAGIQWFLTPPELATNAIEE